MRTEFSFAHQNAVHSEDAVGRGYSVHKSKALVRERDALHLVNAYGDCAPCDTSVSPKRLVEAGSLTVNERTASVVSE